MRVYLLGFALGVTLAWSPNFKANPVEYKPAPAPIPERNYEVGIASWYGEKFHGKVTASGDVYDMNGFTAAHRTLPLGTMVQITNLANNRSVTVRINDRGPWIRGREIDLSKAAARALGFVGAGLAEVQMEILTPPSSSTESQPVSEELASNSPAQTGQGQ